MKSALADGVVQIAGDVTQQELLDLGYLRAVDGRLVVTLEGYRRYLSTLPSLFD